MSQNGKKLTVAGVNFHKSPLEIRSKFAFTTDRIKMMYAAQTPDGPEDFFILSTCNRTEIYSTCRQPESLMNILATNNSNAEELKNYTFIKTGDAAVKHLFRVASGLDSQIVGDYEIIGQLKSAFNLAKAYNRTCGLMEKIVNTSLRASKQVKSRTALSNGTTSVSYAAIQLLRQMIGVEPPLHICLMGLGKMGTLTLKNLKHYLPGHKITLVNRNESMAETAAVDYMVDYAPFSSKQDVIKSADVLIVATGADHAIISKDDVSGSGIRTIFDLSVPSNVSPLVRELKGLTLYNVDELSQIVNQVIEARKSEIPVAEAIIEEHFEEFKQWEARRDLYKLRALANSESAPAYATVQAQNQALQNS